MPPKFSKSKTYAQVEKRYEDEILDGYAEILESYEEPDVVLSRIPELLRRLSVPSLFTDDVVECIQWFYDTSGTKRGGGKWEVARELVSQLTISTYVGNEYDVSDIVDVDKLVSFCSRLLMFRDNRATIEEAWRLFIDVGGKPQARRITVAELQQVKRYLQLDDIGDSILIDMVGCGGDKRVDFAFGDGLSVGIKGFADILGQLGELD